MTNEPDTPFWVSTLFDRIDTMGAQINERLDRINGSVRRHETDIEVLKTHAHPPESCETVDDLQKRVGGLEANDLARRKVWQGAAVIGAAAATVAELAITYFSR
jgi:hypothetical protein